MKRYRRWMAAALAAVLAVLSLSPGLALPAQDPFAQLHIDAAAMDAPERTIAVARYERDEDGRFQLSGTEELTCRLNRVTGDAVLYIQTGEEGIRVTVDYLTDLDGDSVYELLDGGESPVWDVMDAQGGLAPPQDEVPTLAGTQTYILSSELLVQRSRQTAQERVRLLDTDRDPVPQQEFPLCVITLRRTDPDGLESEQTYYLQLYGDILVPFDVSREDSFYEAVLYTMSRGYFTGVEAGIFCPDDPLNRAQLAQVLWRMCGAPQAEGTGFSDVPPDAWFYQSVSWCQQSGLINGIDADTFAPYDPLTREQMASILCRCARFSGASLRMNASLFGFSDWSDISPWAYDSMRWAVDSGLISAEDGALFPKASVSRAELAQALYAYDAALGARGLR